MTERIFLTYTNATAVPYQGSVAALAGIGPDNPDQPAPPSGGLLKLLLGLTH